jgi:hypothetical protein
MNDPHSLSYDGECTFPAPSSQDRLIQSHLPHTGFPKEIFIMKALVPALLLLAPVGFAADEGVGLGFEVGTSYFLPAQKPGNKGMGNFFGVDLNLGSVTVGYYFESLNIKLKSEDTGNVTQASQIDVTANINEVRLVKPIIKEVAVGLGIGMATVKGRLSVDNGAAAAVNSFDTIAPVADVFARVTPISGGEKVKASVNVTLGYRFIAISSTQALGATDDFVDSIDNLNGFRVALSVILAF